jgi:hypothetical protein
VTNPCAAGEAPPLTLVCDRRRLDRLMEGFFIREVLLGGLRRPVRMLPLEPGRTPPLGDNLLVLDQGGNLLPFVDKLVAAGRRNIGVFHMADELLAADRHFYPSVDYVIRNYWFPEAFVLPAGCRCLDVVWVPNGYRFGIGPRRPETLMPFGARPTLLFFSGFLRSSDAALDERTAMLEVVRRHALPSVIMTSSGFTEGLGAMSYAAWMESAKFALVPRGRSVETIRLYDALELGAIPILLASPAIRHLMPDAPLVMLESWAALPGWLAAEMAMPDFDARMTARQQALLAWWATFKRRHETAVAALVDASFARSVAEPLG